MITAFAHFNYADADVTEITASSTAGTMSASYLRSPHVAEKWRATSGSASLTFDLGGLFEVDTVALMGVTLTQAGTTQVRLSTSAPTDGDLYDSGSVVGQVDPRYGYLVRLLSFPVHARYVRVDLTDSSVAAVEVGRPFIGRRTELSETFAPGVEFGYVDLSKTSRSRGGQSYIDRNVGYRTINMTFECLSSDDQLGIIEELDRVVGQRQDLLFIADTASDNMGRDCLWGLRDDMQATVQPYSIGWLRKSFRLVERL